MNHLKIRFIILLFLAAFSISGWCSKIIYPWRATTAIVKAGESFEVWFDADDGQNIDSVELEGPYYGFSTSFSVEPGSWKYDEWSGYTYNRKITVQVPEDAPADRYHLILKTSTGNEISLAAVKIIKEVKSSYYIMHFSDPHRWERAETPDVAYMEQSVVVDIANIIDPEMFIETGDCYWQSTNSINTTRARLAEYMSGTESFNGLHDLNAAYFAIPGNHDTPQHNWYKEPDVATSARAWNNLFGLTCQNFTYGNTRFIGITNAWCPTTGGGDPGYVANYQWQLDAAADWIDSVGKGNLRIGFFHVPQESVPPLYNALKSAGAPFGLLLGGHIHRWETNPYSIDGKPIIYIADGVQNGINGAPFNLYKIEGDEGTFRPVGNSFAAHSGLEIDKNYNTSKLKLSYSRENNGTFTDNTAIIVNKFDFPIEGARVRFVMPKGVLYDVSNLIVTQEFDGDNYHIVDAKVDLKALSTTEVKILPDDVCPDDPNKTKPGNCGCGVAEGTCGTFPLTVNNGNGSGAYYPYENVPIGADPAPPGQVFDIWEIDSGVPTIFNAQLSSTTLYMGESGASVTATYKEISPIYQAEDADYNGPTFSHTNKGYHGSGYLEFQNASNDYIEWTVNVPKTGEYQLIFRYSYSDPAGSRTLELKVNDLVKVDSLDFPLPFVWSSWTTRTSTQPLTIGINKIRLTAIGSSGPDIDEVRVIEANEGLTSLEGTRDGRQNGVVLHQIYPNPAGEEITIDLSLVKPTTVNISIIDVMGREAGKVIHQIIHQAGDHSLTVPLSKIESGTYLIKIRTDTKVYTELFHHF